MSQEYREITHEEAWDLHAQCGVPLDCFQFKVTGGKWIQPLGLWHPRLRNRGEHWRVMVE